MNVDIVLAIDDVNRLDNYTDSGIGNIEDILIKMTTQAEKILSRPYTISATQMRTIIGITKIKYEELIKEALKSTNVPHIDGLSYKEAAVIIKHVNEYGYE